MQIWVEVEGGSCIATIFYNGKARVMWLDSVQVDPARQRQGVGTALMKMAERLAKTHGVDAMELVVNSDNLAAQGLYDKTGYQPTEKVHYRKILRKFEVGDNATISPTVDQ